MDAGYLALPLPLPLPSANPAFEPADSALETFQLDRIL
jgi:hypothetical protein